MKRKKVDLDEQNGNNYNGFGIKEPISRDIFDTRIIFPFDLVKKKMTNLLLHSLFAAILVSSCYASSAKLLSKQLSKANPANFDFEGCVDTIFDNAQVAFNMKLGLDPALGWKNATELAEQIHVLIDKSVDSFVQVCNARQLYAYKLGATYPFCMNRFYLLNRDATDFNDAVLYVHTYKHLEFICSTGFDVFQSNLQCIVNAEHTGGTVYQACFYKFQQIINNNPYMLCDASESFVLCVKDFFTQYCGAETGWVECEKERIGFAYDCPGITC
ncbi:hypothetical protein Y032_0002g920 [Ancylostoma ceylanicum]|uniref:DUF19 domain-containing protein n=1 Tax=Ancylostoma ceylanicum TaxID=53326 RepID=A0A016W1Z2_9BILA|nr:hypothetical protein Y032_0002g920 [Ancylostoma ceylanicum]